MPLRLALLGVWHVHAIDHFEAARHHPEAEIVAVWDRDPDAARGFADQHGLEVFADLDDVLARSDIAAVVVDTATTDHRAVIESALRSGKHVFTEKVLAVTVEDALALADLADEAGLILRVSLQRLVEAPIRTVKRLIDEGRIGTVTTTRIRYAHQGALGHPRIPKHFFDPERAGGGVLIDLGAHPIYLGLYLHDALPLSVSATVAHVTGLAIEDNAVAILQYPGGALSVAEASFVAGFFGYALEATGTGGTIAVGPADMRVLLRLKDSPEWIEQQPCEPLPSTFDQFVAEVLSGPSDRTNLPMAVRVTAIIEAAYRSAASGERAVLSDVLAGGRHGRHS